MDYNIIYYLLVQFVHVCPILTEPFWGRRVNIISQRYLSVCLQLWGLQDNFADAIDWLLILTIISLQGLTTGSLEVSSRQTPEVQNIYFKQHDI